jgi:cystathionine gamma-lyase
MEGAKYAFAFSTGMAAIVTMLSLLKPTDHLLIIDDVYAGTSRYLRKVFGPQTGIAWDMIDFTDVKHVEASFKENTRFCWIESPTNPTMKCVDIAAVAKICKKKGATLIIDNTFMSPALVNPLSLGADVVIHSLTKYIGGHSDVTGGALIFNCPEMYEVINFNMKCFGNIISPFSAFLCLRGSKTLEVRAFKAAENALIVAKYLEKHPKIEKVVYPGLKSHPHY